MNGPSHYREAEWLIEYHTEPHPANPGHRMPDGGHIAEALALAQIHATLALAAAIVDGPAVMRPEDRDDWDRATGRLA